MSELNVWKKCSSCKRPILLGSRYYTCSVSTCNGQRTGYVFCSVGCFEVHLPGARHKDAAAIENFAPKTQVPIQKESMSSDRPATRRVINEPGLTKSHVQTGSSKPIPKDVLIIASRLKEYILARGEMNTSQSVMDILSEKVRRLCDDAIDKARQDGRKTVMDRDFKS